MLLKDLTMIEAAHWMRHSDASAVPIYLNKNLGYTMKFQEIEGNIDECQGQAWSLQFSEVSGKHTKVVMDGLLFFHPFQQYFSHIRKW